MNYLKLAQHLLRGGDRHSSIYIEGLCAALKLRIEGEPTTVNYPQGSLEFDAYYYGCRRGADEFRNALVEANGNRTEAIARLQQLAGDERRAA
ncbi:hypothetical protein [Pseudomonas sihuiensis]|uniref:Uncharacterized protein n=1 Tax=Pseudomonas sihuiensis TaxID=1274359 RepID=A0A1H2LPV1_9PSED|nr:hypothetical protein [Pseudomonas sihuiensis]SDU75340.1 hypothetical protein SAMN05216363_0006 [Pseudomonas sihuiensis]SDU82386.1 hypothetical protein SAMN05216363_1904 [Pseudomonas sihuiensis]